MSSNIWLAGQDNTQAIFAQVALIPYSQVETHRLDFAREQTRFVSYLQLRFGGRNVNSEPGIREGKVVVTIE